MSRIETQKQILTGLGNLQNSTLMLPAFFLAKHYISFHRKKEKPRNSNSNEFDSSNPVILHLLPSSEAKKRIPANEKWSSKLWAACWHFGRYH